MPQFKVYRFDVTGLSEEQRNMLDMMVRTQAEASDYDVNPETSEGIENYPDVACAELCPWCSAVREYNHEEGFYECGGEGEGTCSESQCVLSYDPSASLSEHVDEHVRVFCEEHGIENALVPYRNDGLTYYQQLAYFVRDYHGLEQPKRASRRLP